MLVHVVRPAFTVAFALFSLAALCGGGAWGWLALDRRSLDGITVGGVELAPTRRPSAVMAARIDGLIDRPVSIECGGVRMDVPRRSIGATVDRSALDREVLGHGRSGDPFDDVRSFVRARRGQLDVELAISVDEPAVERFLDRLLRSVERPPRPARLDLSTGSLVPEIVGLRIDRAAARAAIADAIERDLSRFKIPTVVSHAASDRIVPKGLRLDRVLAAYETEFDQWGDHFGRAHNVRTAAGHLDGAILAPHAVFSFNGWVGPRRPRDGYREAPVIVRGELTEGIGGGVCQVASTLHAAAFYAGLDIVEYTPHSRPSHYMPMGLDATVTWPYLDLRIRNPYDFPILVRATVEGETLTVALHGAAVPREVDMHREFVSTRPFTNRVVIDPSLPPGAREVSQQGVRGYTVRRVRYVREGAREYQEDRILVYPPADHIVRTGG
jgi:vancomycin resistance protein YoaR